MPLIDNGVYVAGTRIENPRSLDETYRLMRENDGMGWIGLYRPSPAEIRSVAAEFELHPLAVEDALLGHQRAKLERYDEILFAVLRPARYVDSEETVEFGELHIFLGPGFVVTIRHAESPDLMRVRKRMEDNPDLLAQGPEAVLYAILDQVVDEYEPVIAGLENDIDEIENDLFTVEESTGLSERIYNLSREVINFQRAVVPLVKMLEGLQRGSEKYGVDLELQRSLRDVLDHTLLIVERVASFRAILDNALTVHATIVTRRQTDQGIQQNEEVKKISSWAAILFAPTLVASIYGMNFETMPELHWRFGYPFAIGLMILMGVILYAVFRSRKWL
ncbi:Magnesium transport protein CorA [Frondihabitans sp. 762G35]|uniref:magnesium/cobalt transporter CorA n=1 Tax=Frondihabitans sp. 762G35 TaxID=1446794 RepID=UPI000D20C356|nr:magnesium/cobalt transporter CorA [Frondihabitans sp. 762G35]ARC57695.1 Magnesium transport protein CorA [Frondihabitans sp. 762G35]